MISIDFLSYNQKLVVDYIVNELLYAGIRTIYCDVKSKDSFELQLSLHLQSSDKLFNLNKTMSVLKPLDYTMTMMDEGHGIYIKLTMTMYNNDDGLTDLLKRAILV